jgi:iron complex outermembrane receptor protein
VDNTAGVLSSLTTTIPTPGGPLTIPIFPQGAITPTFAPGSPALLPGTPTDYEDSWSEWTPKVGLNYEVSSEVLLYASYARGFKSGGFNGRPNPVVAGPNTGRFLPVQSYDPEVLDTYEIGFKSSLLDRRLVLNAAAFFSDYQDVQILTLDPNTAFFNTANAGEVDIFGFEVEAVAEPVEGLRFDLGVGYLDDSLPVTPTWTVNVGGQYEVDLAEMGSVRLRADYAYRSEVFFQAENNAFDGQDGYGLLNVRGTYTFPNDRVAVSVYGINVTDEEFFTNRQDVLGPLGTATSQLSAPAEWGAELSLRF